MSNVTSTYLTGTEYLTNAPADLPEATVLEFWQWAFSNLRANSLRGIFAEWLVAHLLEIPQTARDSWNEYDLLTPEGITIEVKAAAYQQAWTQTKPSTITFSRLKGRRLNAKTNQYASAATHNADLYIFCLHREQDISQWDALNLEQWCFYVLTKTQITNLNSASLRLSVLERHGMALDASILRQHVLALITELQQQRAFDQGSPVLPII